MNRRLFFKRSCAGALLLSCPGLLARENEKRLRFGLVTDIHFAHRNVHGTRYYEQSITKLSEAIDVFNRRKLDFMIELGDLKDMGDIPERGQTLSFLDEIEAKFQTFDGPVYHVLGNHDMDSISKSEFLAHTSNYGSAKGKPYYSFGRAEGMALAGTEERRFAGRDLYPRIVGYFLRDRQGTLYRQCGRDRFNT